MSSNKEKIQAVPTNIITGFLGVGKTSAILSLLKQKPDHERWAILVNEFGEVGVDGNFFEGQHREELGFFVQEVPGGCMCCASGLPMQIALNQLLTQAKPHRLLIEPTGLGHPIEVLQLLSNQYYRTVLNIQKTLTLVDARNLAEPRYTEHETFNQQIGIADIVVANKLDLYAEADKQALASFLHSKNYHPEQTHYTQQGKLKLDWLAGATAKLAHASHHHHHHHATEKPDVNKMDISDIGYVTAVNEGEGFTSIGWRFAPERVFDRARLKQVLAGMKVERLKGVFITEQGIFAYNATADGVSEIELNECAETRVEVICTQVNSDWERQLLAAVWMD